MNDHNTAESTQIAAAAETSFEVVEAETEEMEVVEFGNAPLTDINFGF
ncbi:MAG: hypothetical protein H6711_33240 [Myxococcales bacterium]|nr:hypothetical protein [Myxococcales bacterium]